MAIATPAVELMLAAFVLLSGSDRYVPGEATWMAAAAPGPAQAAAKGQTDAPPREPAAGRAEQQPAPPRDQGPARSAASAAEINLPRSPFAAALRAGGGDLGLRMGGAASMPANPFAPAPRDAIAFRPAATYGTGVGPAPAIGKAAAGRGKAFGNYRARSPISPYMRLYSPPTLGVNNYNAYVRPQLQQQRLNQQVETQFRSLQQEVRFQETPLRPAGQIPELFPTGAGTGAATFMNLQPYYPSYPGSR